MPSFSLKYTVIMFSFACAAATIVSLSPVVHAEVLNWPGAGIPVEGDVLALDKEKIVFRIKRSRRVVVLPFSRFTGEADGENLRRLREEYARAQEEKQKSIKNLPVTVEVLSNNGSKKMFFSDKKIPVKSTDTGTNMLQPKSVDLRLKINASALPCEVPVTLKIVWFGAQHAPSATIGRGNNDATQAGGFCEKNIYVETRKMMLPNINFSHFSDPVRRCGEERVCDAGRCAGYAVIITNNTSGAVIFETATSPELLEKARTAEPKGEYLNTP